MKRYIIIISTILLFISCEYNEFDNIKYINNTETTLLLNFVPTKNKIQTRGVSSDEEENTIYNAYVYVFNNKGVKVHGDLYTNINSHLTKEIQINNIPSGKDMSIAIIANVESTNTIVEISKSTLDNITTKDALNNFTAKMKNTAIERGGSFLMSGLKENVNIIADQNNNVSINLKRVDAKISFYITTKNNVKFTPLDWRIVSIPNSIRVINSNSKDIYEYENNYFTSSWNSFDVVNVKDTSKFSFYTFENMVSPKQLIPSSGEYEKDYAMREKQIKTLNPDGSVTNGDFIYARNTASYVELRGNIWYKANDETEISADVIFTIHLGGTDNNFNDYNTFRNTFYKYYVKINSVNNIITEVEASNSDEEPRPGSEGDVVFANVIKELDAHNEIFTINFNQSTIDSTLTWNVVSPFSTSTNGSNSKDYDWIHFSLCNLNGSTYSTNYKQYLGDENVYSDTEFYNNSYAHPLDMYMDQIAQGKSKMLNVKQLTEILKETKKRYNYNKVNNDKLQHLFDVNGNARFTVFVNEYYYYVNPYNSNETVEKGFWKKFVNQKKRVMNIISMFKYSLDRESSKSEALYSIRQASIQTMYNKNSPENFTAWGTQMIQDTTRIIFDKATSKLSTSTYTDFNNGRYNSAKMWITSSNTQWRTYINSDNWTMQDFYNSAKYKCLRLNRDINGDGKIQENEIQWYLTSINQLTDIWLGESSYDANAKLYKYSTWEYDKQWYASSTVKEKYRIYSNYKDNPEILWASEGSSISLLSNYTNGINSLVYYRCVRNLGLPKDESINTIPDHFATYNPTDNTITLNRLDSKSIRGFSTIIELADHNERDTRGYNKPWNKFEINPNTYGTKLTWYDVRDRSQPNSTNPLCPPGWRVPNQRELALMYSLMPRNEASWPLDNHICRTNFSWSTTLRPGFSVSKKGYTLFLINDYSRETGGVRCIRDVIE